MVSFPFVHDVRSLARMHSFSLKLSCLDWWLVPGELKNPPSAAAHIAHGTARLRDCCEREVNDIAAPSLALAFSHRI
jgi:hypothetical protein